MQYLRIPLAMMALALAGCVGSGGEVVQDDVSYGYSLAEFSAAASGRDLTTVVIGNPFGGGDAAFGQAVTSAINGGNYGPQTTFTTTPGPSALPEYKVVYVFNPSPPVGSDVVCEDQPFPTDPAQRPILVRAAFCVQGNEETAATAYLDKAASGSDPEFVSTMQELTRDLFPG